MKLEFGEVICDNCKGTGDDLAYEIYNEYGLFVRCIKCNGEGKLTWTENVFRKDLFLPWNPPAGTKRIKEFK